MIYINKKSSLILKVFFLSAIFFLPRFISAEESDAKDLFNEANKLWIPVYWIMDSNTNPNLYTKWIPANDDAVKSLSYVLWHVEAAILSNKKAPKTASKDAWWVRKLK